MRVHQFDIYTLAKNNYVFIYSKIYANLKVPSVNIYDVVQTISSRKNTVLQGHLKM